MVFISHYWEKIRKDYRINIISLRIIFDNVNTTIEKNGETALAYTQIFQPQIRPRTRLNLRSRENEKGHRLSQFTAAIDAQCRHAKDERLLALTQRGAIKMSERIPK